MRTIGRYVLHEEIASGGMATVHLGQLVGVAGFSRIVAIKRLHPHFAKEPEFVSMFIDEARLASRIQHQNVVTVLEVVSLEDELFLVMDFVQGESLARLTRTARASNKPVPPAIAAACVAGALHGLHAAHEALAEDGEPLHIVHRDVSPQNILVDVNGVARVLDFGVAKAVGRLQTTQDGQVKGKTAYMAPEQIRGHQIDRRADVFSASIVLWELLAGERLFTGASPAEIMAGILERPLVPPSEYTDAPIPPALDAVVLRGLQRDPGQRFQTAEQMAIALEDALPLPPPRRVAEWMKGLVGPSLSKRVNRVSEISAEAAQRTAESGASLSPQVDTASQSQVSSVSLATPVSGARPVRRRRVVAALVVIALVGLGIVVRRRWSEPSAAVASSSNRAPAASGGTSTPGAAMTDMTSTSAAPAPCTIPSASAPAPSASASVIVKPRPLAPPPPKIQPNCNPPYTIGEDGVHIPKKECA